MRRLIELMPSIQPIGVGTLSVAGRWLLAGRRFQQIQLLLLEALEKGLIPCKGGARVAVCVEPDEVLGSDVGTKVLPSHFPWKLAQ